MKFNKMVLIFLALFAALLAGCSSRGQLTNWPAVTADQQVVYLSNGAYLVAWDVETNQEVWRFPEKPDGKLLIFAPAELTEDGQLIVGGAASKDARLFSLNPQTGAINWSFDEADRGWVAAVTIDQGVIYAPNSNGILYAFDLQGHLLWTFDAGSPLWAQPAVEGDTLFLTALNHEIYALDTATGKQRWVAGLPSTSTAKVAVDADNQRLYVGGLMDQIIALDARSGETVWTYPTAGWVWQTPVLKDGVLYFGDQSGAFYALDVAEQKSLWGNLQPDGGVVASPLVLDDLVVFVTETGSIYGVSPDGKIQWTQHAAGEDVAFYTPPVALSDGSVVVAPMNIDAKLIVYGHDGRHLFDVLPAK